MNSPAPRPEEIAALSAELTVIKATFFTKAEAHEMEQRLVVAIELRAPTSDMNAGFGALRAEMNAGFAALRAEMSAGFAALRKEVDGRLAQVATAAQLTQLEVRFDAKLERLESRLVKWMFASMVTMVATFGAMFYGMVQLIKP